MRRMFGLNLPKVEETVEQLINQAQIDASEPDNNQIDGPIIVLTLNVLKNGNTDINFQWADNTPDIANITGKFLYKLCTGEFQRPFERILIKCAEENVRMAPFVETISDAWKKERGSEPIIKPRFALKANQEQ